MQEFFSKDLQFPEGGILLPWRNYNGKSLELQQPLKYGLYNIITDKSFQQKDATQ
jgi:hypothetical protein